MNTYLFIRQLSFYLLPFTDVDPQMHAGGQLTGLGWTMLGLYLISASLAVCVAPVAGSKNSAAMRRAWIFLSIILAFLGLNKQLNLQTLLIKLGRHVANGEHLLPYRRELYVLFFLGFILAVIALFAAVMVRFSADIRKYVRDFPLAAGGCGLIVAYIVIRAATIDGLDQMLGFDLERIPFFWLLEAGGLLLIMIQALRTIDPL
jgi:hypothetical protein